MPILNKFLLMTLSIGALLQIGAAHAQATRTWVSGVGDDANPCSRTAPCKTFAGAISKTAAAGQINVLDPGGFGGLTITKSMSIVSDVSAGGVLVSGTSGIVINAAPTDVVNLRGLNIEGIGTGTSGIRVLSAARVHISDVLVRGFRAAGGVGLLVDSAAETRVFVANSTFGANFAGILVNTTSSLAVLTLENVTIEGNTNAGLTSQGAKSFVRVGDSSITNNATGLAVLSNGKIASFGGNFVYANPGGNGAPTNTIPLL